MSIEPIDSRELRQRHSPLAMDAATFRDIGHRMIDELSERLAHVPEGPVTRGESAGAVRELLGASVPLPSAGTDAGVLLTDVTRLLFEHSLFNGHPRFFGYITASPAPIGMFGDLLAAAVNANVGAWNLAPVATEIEAQTVRWIAELIGYPDSCGGLLVSGGNMANFVGLIAARAAQAPTTRQKGVGARRRRLLVYASAETHTWLQKAVEMSGLGTDAIRWVPADAGHRLDCDALQRMVRHDRSLGHQPFLAVGTAGTVSTGVVDPLAEMSLVCREEKLWFHVDGAYGAPAALVPGAPADLQALGVADSVAVDPHKWLYAPLEAGCVLVQDRRRLRDAFSHKPSYYHFGDEVTNYFECGPQNSRGFRALKVWLALRHVGRDAYLRSIREDIALARHLHAVLDAHAAFTAVSCNLSITTFRYVPEDLASRATDASVAAYLNRLNEEVLSAVEGGGETYLSSAVVDGVFLLRACIVNFHTSLDDVEAPPALVARHGRAVDVALRRAV